VFKDAKLVRVVQGSTRLSSEGGEMTKLRCVALLILASLLIASQGIAGKSKGHSDESSIFGSVRVRGSPSGHLTVAIDQSFPMRGILADGVPDIAFHFAPRKVRNEYQTIAFDLEAATVSFTSGRLTVLSADRNILLNVELTKSAEVTGYIPYYEDRSRDLSETLRINRGKALGRYRNATTIDALWRCGTRGGRCSLLENSGEMRLLDDPEIENPCASLYGRNSMQR